MESGSCPGLHPQYLLKLHNVTVPVRILMIWIWNIARNIFWEIFPICFYDARPKNLKFKIGIQSGLDPQHWLKLQMSNVTGYRTDPHDLNSEHCSEGFFGRCFLTLRTLSSTTSVRPHLKKSLLKLMSMALRCFRSRSNRTCPLIKRCK